MNLPPEGANYSPSKLGSSALIPRGRIISPQGTDDPTLRVALCERVATLAHRRVQLLAPCCVRARVAVSATQFGFSICLFVGVLFARS